MSSSVFPQRRRLYGMWLPLRFDIMALTRFIVVVERGAVVYSCHHHRMGHGGCSVITRLLSGV